MVPKCHHKCPDKRGAEETEHIQGRRLCKDGLEVTLTLMTEAMWPQPENMAAPGGGERQGVDVS